MVAGIVCYSGGMFLLASTGHELFIGLASIGEMTLVVAWGALAFGKWTPD